MVSITGILAYMSGIAVLIGYFMPELVKQYPLVLIGAGIAILAGIIDSLKRKKY